LVRSPASKKDKKVTPGGAKRANYYLITTNKHTSNKKKIGPRKNAKCDAQMLGGTLKIDKRKGAQDVKSAQPH